MPPSIGNERIQKMYVQMRGLPVFGNVDKRFVAAVQGVKVRRVVVLPVHADQDPVEKAKGRHEGSFLC